MRIFLRANCLPAPIAARECPLEVSLTCLAIHSSIGISHLFIKGVLYVFVDYDVLVWCARVCMNVSHLTYLEWKHLTVLNFVFFTMLPSRIHLQGVDVQVCLQLILNLPDSSGACLGPQLRVQLAAPAPGEQHGISHDVQVVLV